MEGELYPQSQVVTAHPPTQCEHVCEEPVTGNLGIASTPAAEESSWLSRCPNRILEASSVVSGDAVKDLSNHLFSMWLCQLTELHAHTHTLLNMFEPSTSTAKKINQIAEIGSDEQ